jgi:hypothetical protein
MRWRDSYLRASETDDNMGKGKYAMEMIRCVWGNSIEQLPIKMLTGQNLKAVEKRRGASIEIADPDLGKKLTHAQLKALSVNFPELDPDFVLPPEPQPLTDAELGDLVAVLNVEPYEPPAPLPLIASEEVEVVAPDKSEEDILREMLDNAGVKHGRVKKIEKLREMVAELK